ncbi:unnamed protein product [Bathycoccus prasinos]
MSLDNYKLSRQWEINHTCINIDFESSDRTSIILDGFDKFNFCACGINTKGHYLVNQSSVHADILYIFCTPVRSQSQDFIALGEKKHQLSKSVFNGYVSEVYKGERDSLWVFPKYIGLGPPASGSSALQEYIMSNKCNTEEVMRGVFESIGVSQEFDRSKINYEINVNTNRIGKTSKGYGNIEKTTSDSMGAGFHRASKSSVCVPQKNLKHINEKLRARLEDFFEGYTFRLLANIPFLHSEPSDRLQKILQSEFYHLIRKAIENMKDVFPSL